MKIIKKQIAAVLAVLLLGVVVVSTCVFGAAIHAENAEETAAVMTTLDSMDLQMRLIQ